MIEDMCGSMLTTLEMPAPNSSTHDAFNCELQREKDYDRNELAERVRTNVQLLNAEQKNVYDSPIKVVDDGTWRHLPSRCSWWFRQNVRHFVFQKLGQDLKFRWLLHPLALLPHCWKMVELHIETANESSHSS